MLKLTNKEQPELAVYVNVHNLFSVHETPDGGSSLLSTDQAWVTVVERADVVANMVDWANIARK